MEERENKLSVQDIGPLDFHLRAPVFRSKTNLREEILKMARDLVVIIICKNSGNNCWVEIEWSDFDNLRVGGRIPQTNERWLRALVDMGFLSYSDFKYSVTDKFIDNFSASLKRKE